jgi:ent-kaurene synthase
MRRYVPTIEEYMSNAVVSFALGPIVLTSLYFVEKRLFDSIVNDYEYNALFRLMSTCGRLLNDLQGFEVFWPLYDLKFASSRFIDASAYDCYF